MLTDLSILEIVQTLAFIAIVVALLRINGTLQRMENGRGSPTETATLPMGELHRRTRFNRALVGQGREELAAFIVSEGELAVAIEEVADNESSAKHAQDQSWWQKAKGWVKNNKELLVGKLNDIGKASMGLG